MDKNILYPAISIIIVLLVAAGIYIAAGALGGTTPHEEEEAGVNASALLFGATEKLLRVGDYTYTYTETQETGYWVEVTISRKGSLSYVHKKDPISERSGYFEGNESIVCIKYMDEEKCIFVNSTSRFASYANSLRNALFREDEMRALAEHQRKLMQYGGLVFEEEVVEKSVDGHPCTEIRYFVDYSGLTVAQLNEIGLSANDPLLLRSRQYNFSMCIDPETYDMYEKRVEFIDLGRPAWMHTKVRNFSWGTGMDVQKPQELAGEEELHRLYSKITGVAEAYLSCLMKNNTERCIAEVAVIWSNPMLCREAGSERDFCLINAGLGAEDPSVCDEVGAGMKDACYIEFANALGDSSFCGRIANTTIREQCLALNTAGPQGECSVDSDCARAGCSSQLCVPASEAPGIATTCEYLPEYACYAQTTCGCVEGRCAWRETPEFLNCLDRTRG